MDVAVYSRAAPGVGDAPLALTERHWAYMDPFADGMIARGPTSDADGGWTGSLHVLRLSDGVAVDRFVADEPYQRAGLFREHVVRGFENLLGRTMWDVEAVADKPRFLVIAHGVTNPRPAVELPGDVRERLVLYGSLRHLADGRAAGTLAALRAPARDAVASLLRRARLEAPGLEIHQWEFGGRR